MAFNVQQFRSQLTGDGARPNLFQCTLTFPILASSGGATSPGGIQDNVNFSVKFTLSWTPPGDVKPPEEA